MKVEYNYYDDGRPKYVKNLLDNRFDRAYQFDDKGRLQEAWTDWQARNFYNGTTNTQTTDTPYRQTFAHDTWNAITNRSGKYWSQPINDIKNYTAGTGRRIDWTYDNAGNVVIDSSNFYTFDVAGRNIKIVSAYGTREANNIFDGDGNIVRRQEDDPSDSTPPSFTYATYATALGGKMLTEITPLGARVKGYIYAAGALLAEQTTIVSFDSVQWRYTTPLTGSRAKADRNGYYDTEIETDPNGIDVEMYDPFIANVVQPADDTPSLLTGSGVPNGNCTLDGFPVDCAEAAHRAEIGSAKVTWVDTTFPSTPIHDAFGGSSVNSGGSFFWVDDWRDSGDTSSADLDSGAVQITSVNKGYFSYVPWGQAKGKVEPKPTITWLVNNSKRFDQEKAKSIVNPIIENLFNNEACVNVFSLLGIDLKKFLTEGIRFGNARLAADSNITNEQLGLTQAGRDSAIRGYKDINVEAVTLANGFSSDGKKPYTKITINSRPLILFTLTGFETIEKGGKAATSLIVHELIHAVGYGGRGKKDWRDDWIYSRWDLDYLESPSEAQIQEACGG